MKSRRGKEQKTTPPLALQCNIIFVIIAIIFFIFYQRTLNYSSQFGTYM